MSKFAQVSLQTRGSTYGRPKTAASCGIRLLFVPEVGERNYPAISEPSSAPLLQF